MNDKIEYSSKPADISLKSKEMDLEAGWLGKCFGSAKNAPVYIAGTLVLLLVGSGIVVLFVQSTIPASDYWKIIIPLLTLVMGYVFGRGSKDQ